MGQRSSLVLSAIVVAHFGWLLETLIFAIFYGGFYDRGFLTMPLCPIYGITLLFVYILLGTPRSGGVMLGRMRQSGARVLVYFLLAAIIPAVLELIGGEVIELITGEVLWTYEEYEYSFGRYICLEIALLWGLLILCFTPIFERMIIGFEKIPRWTRENLSRSFSVLIALDFIGNLIKYIPNLHT